MTTACSKGFLYLSLCELYYSSRFVMWFNSFFISSVLFQSRSNIFLFSPVLFTFAWLMLCVQWRSSKTTACLGSLFFFIMGFELTSYFYSLHISLLQMFDSLPRNRLKLAPIANRYRMICINMQRSKELFSDTEPLFHDNSSTRLDLQEESMRQGHPVPDLRSTCCSSHSC